MSSTSSPPPPMDVPDQSPHYVRALADMGEGRDVIAQEDIYAANGMKLLAKGAKISGRDHERLSLHKLRTPLDLLLTAELLVDGAMLVDDARKLIGLDPLMTQIAERSGDAPGLRLHLGSLALSQPLRFRLTVMRDQRRDLYEHSLRVAQITYAMAHKLAFSHGEKDDLLLAALCHDMGEMHTDPVLLDSAHTITTEERKFIDVHPLTAHVLLQALPGMPPAVLKAVLQHHERLDGSGYPHRNSGAAIGRLARLLCVAEVMEAVGRRDGQHRLDVVLRLNYGRLDPEAVNVLRKLVHADAAVSEHAEEERDMLAQMRHVVGVLDAWRELGHVGGAPDLAFVAERMNMLRSLMLQTGIDPGDVGALLKMAGDDVEIILELKAALGELEWLMADIANEIERRGGAMSAAARAAAQPLLAALRP